MPKLIKNISKTTGLVPGTLVHIGEKRSEKIKISVIDYNENQFHEKVIESIEECLPFKSTSTVTWINIDGVHNPEVIEKICEIFDVHSLVQEDIMNTGQRPKFDDMETCLFAVMKMFMFDGNNSGIESEQVSLIIGANFVLSFQEKEGDVFETVRDRIRKTKGRIRSMGPDYLAYSLMDAIVDGYFLILEKIGEKIDAAEEDLISNPLPQTMKIIHKLKQEAIFLRKSVWPLREVVGGLEHSESKLIKKSTRMFLRNLYDHTIQVIETIETFRDVVTGMLDIYLSSVSNRMNEIMKVLTIIATIFIPMTFIVGVYGMNFNTKVSRWSMPELNSPYGYVGVWIVMISMALVMLSYFKRKHWI